MLKREQEHLYARLEEVLSAEKVFSSSEEPLIQRYLDVVTEILPLLETYEQQSEELI